MGTRQVVEARLLLAQGQLRGLRAVAPRAAAAEFQRALQRGHRLFELAPLVQLLRVRDGRGRVAHLDPLRLARELVHAAAADVGHDRLAARGSTGGDAREGRNARGDKAGRDGEHLVVGAAAPRVVE